MAEIHITETHVALLDDADLPLVSAYKWRLSIDHLVYYARTNAPRSQGKHEILMHRLIMQPAAGMVVDHLNGDGLDNRRSNLRVVTRRENMLNLGSATRASRSGIRGVIQEKSGSWRAQIKNFGRPICIGRFKSKEEARAAWIDYARHLWGDANLTRILAQHKAGDQS